MLLHMIASTQTTPSQLAFEPVGDLPSQPVDRRRLTCRHAMSVDRTQLERSRRDALQRRNAAWSGSPFLPKWVDTKTVGLDEFFTRPEIAEQCFSSLTHWIRRTDRARRKKVFIEPSAGTGAFFDLLPTKRRIGIDILPRRAGLIEHDFLTWSPPETRDSYVAVGNPPFGYRAWLALAFVNHAATFADYVGFILPMAFDSDGKGSPKFRVRGLTLLHSEHLPQDSFTDAFGQPVQVNALWQVWKRGPSAFPTRQSCDSWIDVFTIDSRKERRCGHRRLHEADVMLQRTYYGAPPTLVRNFEDVRYGCGYGIVLKREHDRVLSVLRNTDWNQYSNLAAHNCRHISMYHIRQVLIDSGFTDD